MTDDITKLAKRALELSEKATKGPYTLQGAHVHDEHCCVADCCAVGNPLQARENANFFANARTILPQLATAYLELKEKYDEAVGLLIAIRGISKGMPDTQHLRRLDKAIGWYLKIKEPK